MNDSDTELALTKRKQTRRALSFEFTSSRQWLSRWALVVAEFGAVQIAVQALTALAGLLIVRTLSKQEYALFAIANSMQTTCNVLADLGIGLGVRAIGGRVWQDRYRFGQLLNTALALRWKFATISFVVCIPVAGWMLWRNGAEPLQVIALCTAITAGVIPLLSSSVLSLSQLLHGEYRGIQKIDFGNALIRVILIGMLAVERLNAFLAVLVGVLGNWIQSVCLHRWARDRAELSAPVNSDDRRELLRLSGKALPNTIFFCFQGPIILFILTLAGNPNGVADVTALGRIATLFTIFSVTFGNVLAPRFARCQDPNRLPWLYLILVSGTLLVLAPLVVLAWLFPDPLLWLLGSKYETLQEELIWVMAASVILQTGAVMWNLNSSKAWAKVMFSASVLITLATQVGAALLLDLRQFHDVLVFNLISAMIPGVLCAIDAYLGFRELRRNADALDSSIRI